MFIHFNQKVKFRLPEHAQCGLSKWQFNALRIATVAEWQFAAAQGRDSETPTKTARESIRHMLSGGGQWDATPQRSRKPSIVRMPMRDPLMGICGAYCARNWKRLVASSRRGPDRPLE